MKKIYMQPSVEAVGVQPEPMLGGHSFDHADAKSNTFDSWDGETEFDTQASETDEEEK